MVKRKINAVLTLLTTLLLLTHAIWFAVWILSGCTIPHAPRFIPWALAGVIAAHMLISIDLVVSTYMENEGSKGKPYPKQNKATIVQRISGVLMAPAIALHIAGAAGVMQPPPVVHAVVPLLFFTLALTHTAISISKAFITLGIGSAKTVKLVGRVAKVFCGVTLVICVISFYIYAFTGVAK